MTANPPEPTPREPNILLRVLGLTVPLALIAFLMLPNLGPIFRLVSVPAGSMAPALQSGSYAIISRASYGYSRRSFDWFDLPIDGRWPAAMPQRGDIVVFRHPDDRATLWVKRVIGLPGDTVQLKKGRLLLNGTTVAREAVTSGKAPDGAGAADQKTPVAAYVERLPGGPSYVIAELALDNGAFDNSRLFVVPPGHLFTMGDNRDNSMNSRADGGIGTVPVDLVIGRVVTSF